jgi:hypothetical protein
MSVRNAREICVALLALAVAGADGVRAAKEMEWVRVAADGVSFACGDGGERFHPWGFNYDHDADGRLLEDYWDQEWATVEADFGEMKALGAKVVRVHLQLGKFFVQRISLSLAGRSREQVAKDWVRTMVEAIRAQDRRHLVTVGVIPWALVFKGAKPLFHSREVGAPLDFVSVHFYPKKGEVEQALAALAVYEVGKPLVIEEIFPLECGVEELDDFITRSSKFADGWLGFYWGKTIEDYRRGKPGIPEAMARGWLEYFRAKSKVPVAQWRVAR